MAVSQSTFWQLSFKSYPLGRFATRFFIAFSFLFFTMGSSPFLLGQDKSTEGASQESKHRVEGVVTLPNGSPAENATIYLREANGGTIRLPVKPYVTSTNAKGRYTVSDLKPGTYQIWAEQADLTSLAEKLRGKKVEIEKEVEVTSSVDLKLHQGCSYSVKVIDQSTGAGVPGAMIQFVGSDIQREYKTNQEGLAEIGGLAVSDWQFKIEAPSYAVHQLRTPKQSLGSVTKLLCEMVPGTSLTGMVRDDKGEPIPNVEISAAKDSGMTYYGQVTSRENGEYTIASLPRGSSIRLSVQAEGFERTMKMVTTSAEETTAPFDIVLKKRPYGGDCVVLVTDENDAPIVGANVENMGNSSADVRKAVTDETGKALLNDLYSGFRGTTATVNASGYVTQSVKLETGTREKPGLVTVKLMRGASIVGRLVDPDGNPAPKIRVYYNQGERAFSGGGRTETDAKGYFRFNELPNPCTFTFYTLPPYAPIRDYELPVGTNEEIVVVMEMESVLRVRAIDKETREPIAAFNVKLGFSPERRREDPRMSIPSQLLDPGTDVLGNVKFFRLGQLQQGTPFQVTVSASGYEKAVIRRVEAALEAESKIIDVPLTREAKNTLRTVSGYLRDSDGRPVAGAKMHLIVGEDDPSTSGWNANWSLVKRDQISRQAECLQFLTTSSNKEGFFKFERAKVAPWMQIAHMDGGVANGRHTVVEPVKAETLEDLALVANRGGTLHITFDRKRFPSAQSVQVSLPRLFNNDDIFDYESKQIESDTKEIVFKALPPGEYSVVLEGERREVENARMRGAFTTDSLDRRTVIIEEDATEKVDF